MFYKIVIKEVVFVSASDKREARQKASEQRVLVCDRRILSTRISNPNKIYRFVTKLNIPY